MKINISTERCEIISSGTVIIPSNDYVEFEIENLRFRFSMVQNKQEASQGKYQTTIEHDEKGDYMVVNLINFSSSFFATPREEIRMGQLDKKGLYLRFSITAVNRKAGCFDGLLSYTWMLTKDELKPQNTQDDVR